MKDEINIIDGGRGEMSFEYAQGLFDEWVAYAENCLKKHNWRFFGFQTWLGAIKNLSDSQIEEVIKLTLITWPGDEEDMKGGK